MTNATAGRLLRTGVLAVVAVLGAASVSSAQGYISPFIGYDFGGDSGCPAIDECEDKNLNIGVAVGSLGSVFGSELEFAYAKNFFGEFPGGESSVLTLMGNVMLAPKFGPAQPYALVGLGLIKTNIDFTVGDLLESSNNHFGWDIGGGLIIFFSENVGVRGDIRHFHALQDLEVVGIPLADTKLDFGRVAGALVFKF
jgi:opacity protein-like surface antigen